MKFTVPDAEPYTDWIPVRNMRESAPTRLSKLEREYFNKNKESCAVFVTGIGLCAAFPKGLYSSLQYRSGKMVSG